MRPIIRLIYLILALPVAVQAGELLQIYGVAQTNDATLNAARHLRDAALEKEPQARSLLLPQLSGSYQVVFNHSNTSVSVSDPITDVSLGFSQTNHETDRDGAVNLTQALFNLESWYRLMEAGEQTALAQVTYREAEQSLLLRVSEAYFEVLGSTDSLRTATAEKDALAHQLETAKQNLQVGQSSVTDVQDVQARYDLTVARELDAEQGLQAANEALAEITKQPLQSIEEAERPETPDTSAPPRIAPLRVDAKLPDLEPASPLAWVKQADGGNLDVLTALMKYKVAARSVQVAKSDYLPTVSGTASYANSRQEVATFPTRSSGFAVGVGVTVPFYSGGATQSAVREAVATREARLAEYDGAHRQAERNTSTAYQSVMSGAARIRAYRQAVTSSRSALEASQTGLQIGTRTAVDVLNAQQQRYQAQRDYDHSRYEYLLSILRLKAAAGHLAPSDLSEIDALLAPS